MYKIIESVIVAISVIALFWRGIYVGRTYGTFEKFLLAVLEDIKKRIE